MADGHIAVEHLLVNLHVGHEAFVLADELCEKPGYPNLVRVFSAHQIHGDIGVDEDHSGKRFVSISCSIVSMSPTGKLCRAASATARSLP